MGILFFEDKASNDHSSIQHATDLSNVSFTFETVNVDGNITHITKVWDRTKNFCVTVNTDLTCSQIAEAYVKASFLNKNIRICKDRIQEVYR